MECAVEISKRQWAGLCQVRQSPLLRRNKASAHALPRPDRRKDALGFMVVIGDQCDKTAPVFIGFAPEDGLVDLLRLVQFANHGHMAVLHFFVATFLDVEEHLASLAPLKCRTDTMNWFVRHEVFEKYLRDLKAATASPFNDWGDEDGCELAVLTRQANHGIRPETRQAKVRRNTKRNTKRRRR